METQNIPDSEKKMEQTVEQLNILLAYDGSKHAQAAVDLLASLPIRNSKVTCLAVLATQSISHHSALEESLMDGAKHLGSYGLNVDTQLKAGNPAVSIIEWSQDHHSDLIVMGARGLRATFGILLGGVAQQVVEYSTCPVLVVREPFKGLRRVLVVTDGSESSQRATGYLVAATEKIKTHFPLPEDVDLRLMTVLPPALPPQLASRTWSIGPDIIYPPTERTTYWDKPDPDEEIKADAMLSESAKVLQAGGYQVITVLQRGDAATEIIQYALDQEIDMIVCGSRGLNPVSSWLLGSVSRKLVHYAGCSVLIVK